MSKPIIALATAPLKSALAVIRASGEGILNITDGLFSKKVSDIAKRESFVGTIHDEKGNPIDEVVLLAYPAPHSMTGEDVIEIMPHGSMLIVNQIIEAYLAKGCVYACRGEFSSRAFYNGKLDLMEAEAINEMINASTSESKQLALLALQGGNSSLIKPVQKQIADLLSLIEVNIDYPEYTDIEEANEKSISLHVKEIRESLKKLISGGEEGKIINDGIKVAIVGEPNVGKSSLLNSLLQKQKALVSDIPGTTRDVVEGEINVRGIPLHLLDTAGVRESKDTIEEMGVALTKKSILEADVVVLLREPNAKAFSKQEEQIKAEAADKKLIVCYNKDDLISKKDPDKLYISAKNGDIEALKESIFSYLGVSEEAFSSPSLSNARQLGLLKGMDEDLSACLKDCQKHLPIDLISVNLQAAYNKTRLLLGEEVTTDYSDEIFSRFCVGK